MTGLLLRTRMCTHAKPYLVRHLTDARREHRMLGNARSPWECQEHKPIGCGRRLSTPSLLRFSSKTVTFCGEKETAVHAHEYLFLIVTMFVIAGLSSVYVAGGLYNRTSAGKFVLLKLHTSPNLSSGYFSVLNRAPKPFFCNIQRLCHYLLFAWHALERAICGAFCCDCCM